MLCFPFALFVLLGTDSSNALIDIGNLELLGTDSSNVMIDIGKLERLGIFSTNKMIDIGKRVLRIKSTWRFYLEENGKRMVMAAEENGTIIDCYAFGDEYIINVAMKVVPHVEVLKLDSREINSVINHCIYAKWNKSLPGVIGEELWTIIGIFSGMMIYPGTKWCGAGNVSASYDDLGPEVEADRCCRDHDHCKESIGGFRSKYGLTNYSPYTRSHCDCDDKFYHCMREAGTQTSNSIGMIYFNDLHSRCFRKEHPIIDCKRHVGLILQRCQEYILDEEKEPIWQFFDAKYFQIRNQLHNHTSEYILNEEKEPIWQFFDPKHYQIHNQLRNQLRYQLRKSDDEDNEVENTNQKGVAEYIQNLPSDSYNLPNNLINKDFFF